MRKKTTAEFIADARKVHGDRYDYALVDYKMNKLKVKIICLKHGVFEQTADNHLGGAGCPKCASLLIGYKKRSTKTEFIKKSKATHGDTYNYSLVDYKGNKVKVKIVCPVHGVFEQLPYDHIKGHGCHPCAAKLRGESHLLDTATFIEESRKTHGDNYDYSLVQYKDSTTRVKIICNLHGEFEQLPRNHYANAHGCPSCGKAITFEKVAKPLSEFLIEARKVHGTKFSYINDSYRDFNSKMLISCPKHGQYKQSPYHHLKSVGCKKCGVEKRTQKKRLTRQDVIERSKSIHNNKYDYSQVEYKTLYIRVTIICKKHGPFRQAMADHIYGECGCPKCKLSKGEIRISEYLLSTGLEYEVQKRFKECRGHSQTLAFDFFVPSCNLLIEYDGKQHYVPNQFFGGDKAFKKLKQNDEIKNRFALKHGIKLIRIPYTEFYNIEGILSREIQQGRTYPIQLKLAV